MSPPFTCRIDPRLRGPGFARLRQALALVVASGVVSCFGGQTGTELTPEDRGVSAPTGSSGANDGDYDNDETQSETPGDSVDSSGPPPAELCDASASALARFEADTTVSLQGLQQFVARANPFTLFATDGAASTASFEFEFGAVCVRVLEEERVLSASLIVRVVSHDARFDFVLRGIALAYSHMPSGIGRVELDVRVECAASAWGNPSSDCASLGTDMSGYVSARLETSARIQTFGDSVQLLGAVQISGLPANGCQQESCSASTWLHVADVAMARTD